MISIIFPNFGLILAWVIVESRILDHAYILNEILSAGDRFTD